MPLVDQIREALDADKFPLFVTEGNTSDKLSRIRHSGYLQRSLRSFAQICRNRNNALFIYGHSLAPNDEHVLRLIERGTVGRLYVSIYGDADSPENRTVIERARRMAEARSERQPLAVRLFDAATAKVWG